MFKVKNFEKPIFYLYALVCPIENEIKYIGMSKSPKTRFKQHLISNEKMIEFLIRDKFENTFINKQITVMLKVKPKKCPQCDNN